MRLNHIVAINLCSSPNLYGTIWNNMEQYGTIWNNHGFWLWPIPNCICAGRCCDSIRGAASSDPKSLLEFPSLQLGPKMCMLFGLCCIYLRMELLSFIMGRCFVCRGITVSSFNSIKFQPVTPFLQRLSKYNPQLWFEKCPSLPGFLIGM